MSYSEQGAYIKQLSPMEQQVLHIAASHLETSFSLVKSIGFQEWQEKQQPTPVSKEVQQSAQPKAPPIATPVITKKKLIIKK